MIQARRGAKVTKPTEAEILRWSKKVPQDRLVHEREVIFSTEILIVRKLGDLKMLMMEVMMEMIMPMATM